MGGSTRVPLVRRRVEELFGRKPHSDVNPDEVVAVGAAVQADILISGRREMLLLDVTPLSLGIETLGGVTSKIILRNSTIPASGREMFTTGVDNQTAVDVHVLQGERELAADCRSLARFRLRGIPPMPAGLPRIEVRFQIDANGILSVAARELRTGVEQAIDVTPSYGLTDEEVERMLIESFEHAEADFDARLLIDARNEAESVVQATEKSLRRTDFDDPGRRRGVLPRNARRSTGAGGAEAGDGRHRSRRHRPPDPHAQRRHPAPGRGDDEPQPQAGLDGQERGQRVRDDKNERLMPKVTFIKDGQKTTVEFEHGKLEYQHHGLPESFLDLAMNCNVPLEHACGGSCACTTCHLIVKEGMANLSDMEDNEADRLDTAWDLTTSSRLGCQAIIKGDVVVEFPMYTRNYVQEGGAIQLGKSDAKDEKTEARP